MNHRTWINMRGLAEPASVRRRIGAVGGTLLLLHGVAAVAVFLAFRDYPLILGLATIAYGLGLRHAVDADHIAAIDNTTRKFMQEGKYPAAVGLFFALGHSSVVIVLSLMVAASTRFVSEKLPALQAVGPVIGTTVSSLFLLALGVVNLVALLGIIRIWRDSVVSRKPIDEQAFESHLEKRGLLFRFLKPLMRSITHSWQLYFVGALFGLGFDTASEIALLSLSAASASSAIPLIYIVAPPLAFTAAMTLVDSLNAVLMLGAYGWAYLNPARKIYYNLVVTLISVGTAFVIGGIEAVQIISSRFDGFHGVAAFVDKFQLDNLGYFIIGIFLASWLISMAIHWVRREGKTELALGLPYSSRPREEQAED